MLVTMRLGTLMRIVAGVVLTTFVATLLLLSSLTEDGGSEPKQESPVTGSVTA